MWNNARQTCLEMINPRKFQILISSMRFDRNNLVPLLVAVIVCHLFLTSTRRSGSEFSVTVLAINCQINN